MRRAFGQLRTANQGDAYGILSGNAGTQGYDKASGLGLVDAANLVNAWTTTGLATSSAILSILPVSVTHGTPLTATVTVSGNSPTGQVSLNSQAANGSVGAGPLVNGTLSASFRTFPGGTYGVRAHHEGDAQNYPSDSNFVSITVTSEPSLTTLRALAYDPGSGATTTPGSAPYGTVFSCAQMSPDSRARASRPAMSRLRTMGASWARASRA